jgi:diguanylate cyclase (GGDEF)-like protein/PAS domain S-box-containing protein
MLGRNPEPMSTRSHTTALATPPDLLEDAPIAIYSVDLGGRVASWNHAAEELFGWTADEIVGEPVPFIPPGETRRAMRARDRLLAGDPIEPVTYCPITKDGTPRHVVTSASLVHDTHDRPPVVVGFAVDVTETQNAADAVARAENKWRALLQSTSDTVTLVDREGRIRHTTGEFTDVLGYDFDWWPGQSGFDLIHPDDVPRAAGVFAELLDHPTETYAEVLRTRHATGRWELIEYTAVNRLDDPLVEAIVMTSRNVTELTQAEAMLADEAKVLEQIARGDPLRQTLDTIATMVDYHTGGDSGVFVIDAEGPGLAVCAAPSMPSKLVAAALSGTLSSGRPRLIAHEAAQEWGDFRRANEVDETHELWSSGYRAGWSVPVVATRDRALLGTIAVLYVAPRLPADREREVVAVASHLAAIAIERDRAQRVLEHQARHDQLTGLPNRWTIIEQLDRAITAAQRRRRHTAVLLLDLDRLKVVNDSLGHGAGDDLLRAFGQRLQGVTGDRAFVGHFGGDEFAVIVDDVSDFEEVRVVASRIDLALREPFVIRRPLDDTGYEHHLSASIGVAFASEGESAHEVLQHADAAMYRAKDLGRDRLEIYDETLQHRATELLRLDRELRTAVERAELTLHYQPKVALADGRVLGVEALLRWKHPDRGVVLPSEFIDVAEDTGLIVRIGTWVLDEAVHQASAWVAQLGLDRFGVAVNLSARQLTAPGLVTAVANVLERHRWPPAQLTLELTESILIDDAEATLRQLEELKRLGVKLAIDDFGTGYSSLSYLHRFPVDIVKVDRAFVSGLRADGEGSAVATAVVHMARALGLIAAAEGVEDERQLAGLRSLGCDWAQGFLFAAALPADEITELLRAAPRW